MIQLVFSLLRSCAFASRCYPNQVCTIQQRFELTDFPYLPIWKIKKTFNRTTFRKLFITGVWKGVMVGKHRKRQKVNLSVSRSRSNTGFCVC